MLGFEVASVLREFLYIMLWGTYSCPFSLEFFPCLRLLRVDFYIEEHDHLLFFPKVVNGFYGHQHFGNTYFSSISPELVIAIRICIFSANRALSLALLCISLLPLGLGSFSALQFTTYITEFDLPLLWIIVSLSGLKGAMVDLFKGFWVLRRQQAEL